VAEATRQEVLLPHLLTRGFTGMRIGGSSPSANLERQATAASEWLIRARLSDHHGQHVQATPLPRASEGPERALHARNERRRARIGPGPKRPQATGILLLALSCQSDTEGGIGLA
jgi:hypothetical protein